VLNDLSFRAVALAPFPSYEALAEYAHQLLGRHETERAWHLACRRMAPGRA